MHRVAVAIYMMSAVTVVVSSLSLHESSYLAVLFTAIFTERNVVMLELFVFIDEFDSAFFALELQTQSDSIANVFDSDFLFGDGEGRKFEGPQLATVTDVNDIRRFFVFGKGVRITAAW